MKLHHKVDLRQIVTAPRIARADRDAVRLRMAWAAAWRRWHRVADPLPENVADLARWRERRAA